MICADLPKVRHARLLQVLRYSKTSGHFTWLSRMGKNNNIGKRAGGLRDGYVVISIDGREYPASQLAWFYVTKKWAYDEIDHKNHIRNDNRWKNLRAATHAQNTENLTKRAGTTSRFIGVTYDSQRALWLAKVTVHGRVVHIGRFATENAAARARDKKVRELNLIMRPLNFGRGHRALSRQ